MYDLILWKNRRTEKANTYAVTQNPDKTITLTPVPGGKYRDRAVITAPKRIRKYLFRGWIGGGKEQRNIPI